MTTLQTIFETELEELLSRLETSKMPVSHQPDIIKDFTESAIHDSAKDILETMLNAAPDDLKTVRVERQKYSKEIQNQWEKPLLLLELLILIARDFGIELNEESRYCTINPHDHVFHALVRLQARACHTSLAILSLLKAGFADDAFARWRSVHEVAVTSMFIRQNDQQLAQKYLQHEIIQQYKLALAYSSVQNRIKSDGVSEQELNSLKSCRDALVEKYGPEFKKDYGWAADALPHKQSSFSEIEKATQLDHLRPYYKMASDNIHANSHGVQFRVGLTIVNKENSWLVPAQQGWQTPDTAPPSL